MTSISTFSAPTLTELHAKLCHDIVHATADELDVISSVDVQIHNTISEADSMEWDFNLKNMWLTKSRWSMMAKQYIDPDDLQVWLKQITGTIGVKGRGQATLRTKIVKPRGGEATGHTNKQTRRWGSCMLAITYSAKPQPQITLYSRTSYLGYLAALDLSVAWMCARYAAKELGIEMSSIRFVWMNESLQYHNFKSMAYLLNHPVKKERKAYRAMLMWSDDKLSRKRPDLIGVLDASPALQLTRKWLQKVIASDKAGETLGDMTYNTYRRIRRRFHTEVMGYEYAQQFEGWSLYKQGPQAGEQKEFFKAYQPLPDTDIHDCDFSAIGMPLTGEWGVDYDGDEDTDDEDDD